jgi:hypothetical protein
LKDFLHQENITFQLVPPGVHRANAAERAIRTFKNHFIAGLSSTDSNFPLHLWDRLLPQAVLTLNLLRGSRINPNLSAWAQVHGTFDFDRTPIAPPGTRVLVHSKPGDRTTWAPHALDGWYIGPTLDHYRCHRVWMVDTRRERISDTLSWFPQQVRLPVASPQDLILSAATDLISALRNPLTHPFPSPLTETQSDALNTIADIVINTTTPPSTEAPPVSAPSTSSAPTAPAPVPTSVPATIPAPSPAPVPAPVPLSAPTATIPPTSDPAPVLRVSFSPGTKAAPTTAPTSRRSNRKRRKPNKLRDSIHTCAAALHSDTGELVEYQQLLRSSDGKLWEWSNIEEIARLAQGYPPKGIPLSAGTNTFFFIAVSAIPPGRTPTYLRIVVTDRPQKAQPRRVRFTVGGDRITYPGAVSTKTSSLATAKLLFNSVISTPGALFMTIDIKDFYLNTKMSHFEYMWINVRDIPAELFEYYKLAPLVKNGRVCVEIRRGMYGLPQAGRLANDELVIHLAAHGYIQSKHTPGLFTHTTRPISFCLVVDDFGVKYVGKEHAEHLQTVLSAKYQITSEWSGDLYLGLHLAWDYTNRTVDLSMPNYVEKALQRFNHVAPSAPQDSPHAWSKPVYGASTQFTPPEDTTEPLSPKAVTRLQEIIGVFLYYARAIDSSMLVALGSLAAAQSAATEATNIAAQQLMDYAHTHPSASVRYHSSEMILHVHSDASYLSEPKARSRAGGLFFLNGLADPASIAAGPKLNGAVHVNSIIMRNVLASATEAEVGALFHNAQEACILRQTLDELGHPQPATPIQTDNSCAEGILNDTVKQKRSKAIDMRYYWTRDRVEQQQFYIHWKKGTDNYADYFTKQHPPSHHNFIRPSYFHESPPVH